VFVFAEIRERSAAVFVRDAGPGFEPDRPARAPRYPRRDPRLDGLGAGQAVIDSSPGAGTEVACGSRPCAAGDERRAQAPSKSVRD
jgi:hypothetical protein